MRPDTAVAPGRSDRRPVIAIGARRGGITLLMAGVGLLAACYGRLRLIPSDADRVLNQQLLQAPHPGRPGTYGVRRLFYGSGTDRRRPEYRDSVTVVTDSVDASRLVQLGEEEAERNRYWGFTPRGFPVNGRVWYPEGPGPFPLVLVVHGNHDPRDFSDPGYDYLGELLASRGFILVSVDMNFLNGGIREENDARGWMLLKHLQAWRGFAADAANPFHDLVALDRVALIGHSRGGEAVGHAAAFNRLSHYPDDAMLTFDFGFGIRAVIAIAPVDGQYLPTGRKVPLENINYMVFHGSHDGDVTSFHGLRQYHRVRFTDEREWFKTAVYVYRANHGQWNTSWGRGDSGSRSGRVLDLRGLLPMEHQVEFGRIYVSAFLEATLHDDDRYLPMFRDHRVIGSWLPPTMYVTRLQTSGFRPLATFEEDIDVTTGTEASVTLEGVGLSVWREGTLLLRSRNRATTSRSQENQVVWLGWEADSMEAEPAYHVRLPGGLSSDWALDRDWTLDLSLAPDRGVDDSIPPDVSLSLTDESGRSASVSLSRYAPLRQPFDIAILRRNERQRFPESSEVILQTFSVRLADFLQGGSGLDLSALQAIRLGFDSSRAGRVVVDDIGFSRMPEGFTRVAADGR